jgi:benzoate 4-monooxygenase
LNLDIGETLTECSVMMNAGSDTTAAALTGTIYLLYKHPKVLAKLREKLDNIIGDEDVPQYNAIANLPYLRACMEDSLGCKPASTMGLPRVVPEGGRTIAGKFIKAGVRVSVPTHSILRNPEAFKQPETFNPDHGFPVTRRKRRKLICHSALGPRACIGRNIAYFEQLALIATRVHNCDFELRTIERFNGNPDKLIVGYRKRVRM